MKKASNSRSAFSAANPTPQSRHRDQNLACIILARPDHQLARPVRDRLHRFNAVDDEIEDDLLQLDPIAEDRGKGRGEFHSQRHPVAGQFVMQQADHLVDDFIDVERRLLIGSLVDQRADALDHFARPVAVLDDGLHRAARFLQVGRVAVEPAQAGCGVGDDGGQRLVHLMGDRGGELPERRHARDMRKFRLRLMQLLFGSLARRDVRHRADKFDAAGCIRYRMRRGMDMFDRAVGHQQPIFVIEILAVAGRAVDGLLHARPIVGMNALKDRVEADRRRLVVAEYPEGLVRPDDFAGGDAPAEAAGAGSGAGLRPDSFGSAARRFQPPCAR